MFTLHAMSVFIMPLAEACARPAADALATADVLVCHVAWAK